MDFAQWFDYVDLFGMPIQYLLQTSVLQNAL